MAGLAEAASDTGLDASSVAGLEAFLDRPLPSNEQRVEDIFRQRFSRTPPGKCDTRFSAGDVPVLYTSLTRQTAQAEVQSYLIVDGKNFGTPLKYWICSVELSGPCTDLTASASAFPLLISTDKATAYPWCQNLARDLQAEGCQLFQTLSARMATGININALSEQVIVGPVSIHERVEFHIDDMGKIEMLSVG